MPKLEQIENYNKTKKTKAEIWFDVKNILLKLMFSLGVTCLIITVITVIGIPIVLLIKSFPMIMGLFVFLFLFLVIFYTIKDY